MPKKCSKDKKKKMSKIIGDCYNEIYEGCPNSSSSANIWTNSCSSSSDSCVDFDEIDCKKKIKDNKYIGYVGKRGKRGKQGCQGKRGDTGKKGKRGSVGPQGKSGPRGPCGPCGPCGLRGKRGPKGDCGPQGEDGLRGPRGFRGQQGPPGPAGKTKITRCNILDMNIQDVRTSAMPFITDSLNYKHDDQCFDIWGSVTRDSIVNTCTNNLLLHYYPIKIKIPDEIRMKGINKCSSRGTSSLQIVDKKPLLEGFEAFGSISSNSVGEVVGTPDSLQIRAIESTFALQSRVYLTAPCSGELSFDYSVTKSECTTFFRVDYFFNNDDSNPITIVSSEDNSSSGGVVFQVNECDSICFQINVTNDSDEKESGVTMNINNIKLNPYPLTIQSEAGSASCDDQYAILNIGPGKKKIDSFDDLSYIYSFNLSGLFHQ